MLIPSELLLLSSGVRLCGADVFIAIEGVRVGLDLVPAEISCTVPWGSVRKGEPVVEDEGAAVLFCS